MIYYNLRGGFTPKLQLQHRHLLAENADDPLQQPTQIDGVVSSSFLIFLSCLVGFIVLLQLVLTAFVYKHRKHSTLKLHQPGGLIAYGVLSALATSSCILFIPFNDLTCTFRDFCVSVPITVMGNILLARSWRINLLMSPALGIGREEGNALNTRLRRNLKERVMTFLTNVSALQTCNRKMRSERRRSSSSFQRAAFGRERSFKQTVSVKQLVFLATILSTPQLVVQLCKIFVPTLQSDLGMRMSMTSTCVDTFGGNIIRWLGGV